MATVSIDTTTEATLSRLAAQRGQTHSDVVRDAIAQLAKEDRELTALHRLQPFAGIAKSGGRQLSQDRERRFLGRLEAKRRANRSG